MSSDLAASPSLVGCSPEGCREHRQALSWLRPDCIEEKVGLHHTPEPSTKRGAFDLAFWVPDTTPDSFNP